MLLKYRDLWLSDMNIIRSVYGLLTKEVYKDAKQYSSVYDLNQLIIDSCVQISSC